jgi:methylmalonyl-CoA/ethylmalonyl-CoA epimerase
MDRLHHIGFVVPSIGDGVGHFISGMGLSWDGQVFHDPVQTVRVTFLDHESSDAPLIELVEPASPQSRVAGFLKRGGGLHHLCYEVDSLDTRLETALEAGAVLLLPPAEAVAFSGRRIAWVCTPERLLIEYLGR